MPLAAAALMFTSCEELENVCGIDDDDFAIGESYVEATGGFIDIVNRVDVALRDSTLQTTGMNNIDGANCTLTSDSLFIDFGSTNVNTSNGNRRGRIKAGISGDYFTAGSSVGIMTEDFYYNDVQLAGDVSITNTTGSAYELACINMGVGTEIDFTTTLTLSWTAGFATMYDLDDDSYTLSGMSSGTSTMSNNAFNATINPALSYDRTCQYGVTEGVASLTLTGDSISTANLGVDFLSNDACNNLFKITADCDGNNISVTRSFDGF
ncbi:MAG: hypothetical protein SchgKO_16960 [Schleiferiaceae bacterium]